MNQEAHIESSQMIKGMGEGWYEELKPSKLLYIFGCWGSI